MTGSKPLATIAAPEADAADASRDGSIAPVNTRAEQRLRMLAELAEIGMDLARALRGQIQAQSRDGAEQVVGAEVTSGPIAIRGDLGLVFSRIAKAVRLTLALEAKFDENLDAWRAVKLTQRVELRANAAEALERAALYERSARKAAVQRAAEDAIEAETRDEEDIERLLDDMHERLGEDDYEGYANRPIGETVARICKDLGLTPDWDRWADEDWALEEAQHNTPGSPYAKTPQVASYEGAAPGLDADSIVIPKASRKIGPP